MPKGYSQFVDSNNKTKVILYKTVIVIFDHINKLITLNSGGWTTMHTKKCINIALSNTPYKVFQRDHVWYVTDGITITPYSDHMQLICQ